MRSIEGGRTAARVVAGLGLVGVMLLYGAGIAQAASVSMVDNAFQPASITVTAGETITWTNDGQNPHTATADDGAFDTGTLDPGESGSATLDTPGTYPYYCQIHGAPGGIGMSGTITVQDTGGGGGGGGGGGTGGTGGTEPLPQTGTPLPLIGGIGLVLLATGLWVGRRRFAR